MGTAVADNRSTRVAAVDARIETDPERFWDHYQADTLKAVYEHVMKVHEGKPRGQDAPFFGELTVDLTLSEPDYEVGVDKEQVMSMETIHEDIYFTTLSFFDVLGRYTRNANLEYPGRIIPVMRPKADGKGGRVKITFTAFDAPRPMVILKYRERGGTEGTMRLDIPKVDLDRPSALAALVRAGRDGIERLDIRVKVDTERDERAELVKRVPERQVDARLMSAGQVKALVEHLERLRAAGLYSDALAYHDLHELRITAGWTHDINPNAAIVATLPSNGRPAAFPDIRSLLPAGYRHAGEPIVQWDTPIPPGEAYELLAKMSTFPEATVYKAGESYLGKDIWAMDLMSPVNGTHWSQAKATVFKPTVVYTARQHANEVSSTSHVLKLAELLLTDAEFKKRLQKGNRDRIWAYMKEASEIMALNRRTYDRYMRYGVAWDNDSFKSEDFTHGALIYTAIKGARAGQGGQGGGGGGDSYMTRYPNVTIWTGTTEAPDETAHGPWLHMVAAAGLQWDKASLDYLFEGQHVVERRLEPFVGGISLSVHRPRPPRPPKSPPETSDQQR